MWFAGFIKKQHRVSCFAVFRTKSTNVHSSSCKTAPQKQTPESMFLSPCLYLSCSVFNNLCLASWVFISLERIGHEKTDTTAKKKPEYKSWEKLYSEEWNSIKDCLSCSSGRNSYMSSYGGQKSTIPNVLKITNLFWTWSWKRLLMVDRFIKSVKTVFYIDVSGCTPKPWF